MKVNKYLFTFSWVIFSLYCFIRLLNMFLGVENIEMFFNEYSELILGAGGVSILWSSILAKKD